MTDILRGGIRVLLDAAMGSMPTHVRESFIAHAAHALLNAKTAEQAELEITAILGAIQDWVKKNA